MLRRFLTAIILLGISNQLQATIVVPSGNTSVEGNFDNGFPFNIANFSLSSQRYQQVYSGSAFGTSPMLIQQILFRPDSQFGNAFSSVLPDIQINMSTTASNVDALSATFATNVGADDTVVVPRGPLSLSSSDTPGPGNTRAFDIVISLVNPFLYDPNLGNLLLDVRNFGGGRTTQFDAAFSSDPVSRDFALGGVASAAGTTDTGGLITAFNFTTPNQAAPEAASLITWSILVLCFRGSCCRQRAV